MHLLTLLVLLFILGFRFMTQMKSENVAAFIGPDESCISEALLAAAWNIPMLSFVSKTDSISLLCRFKYL